MSRGKRAQSKSVLDSTNGCDSIDGVVINDVRELFNPRRMRERGLCQLSCSSCARMQCTR